MANAIEFKLGADSRALKTGLDAAKAQVSSFKNEVGGLITGLFAGIGIESLIKDFARVQDIADQFGVSAESIQRVRGAAETSGTSVEFLAKQMAKVTIEANKIAAGGGKGLEIAGEGGSEAAKAFAKLNIEAATFAQLPLEEQLLSVAAGMDAIDDEGQKIAVAYQLFGAKGKEILPLLLQGHQALQEEFARTAVASNEMVRQIAAADDQLTRVANTVKVGVASGFAWLFDAIQETGWAIGGAANLTKGFFGALGDGFQKLKSGDFSGAADAFSTSWENAVEDARNAMAQVQFERDKQRESLGNGRKGGGLADGPDPVEQFSKRKSLEERLAEIQEERLRKQLDAEQQILDLKQKQEDATVRAGEASDPKERAALEDEAVKYATEIGNLQDQQQKDAEEAQKKIAKEKIDAEKRAADYRKKADDIQQDKIEAAFRERQRSEGFVSGINDAQQGVAGVNYQVINQEAEKQVRLQEEMAAYLKSIDAKKWVVEVPEAQ